MTDDRVLGPDVCREVAREALAEDLGSGDVTTSAIVQAGVMARAAIVARTPCVVSGLPLAREVFRQVDSAIAFEPACEDGHRLERGSVIARLQGPAAGLLIAERTALNALQHLSGIATLTRRFVDAAGDRLQILDTRKTLPGLRALAKYAVRCGGGVNHRMRLDDGVLIKDNHIRIAGGIAEAVRRVRAATAEWPIEVEAQSLEQVDEAIAAGVETIMLDNLSDEQMQEAVRRIAGRARVEISGGITLDRIATLADIGADCVSVGALTHSAPSADISLEFDEA